MIRASVTLSIPRAERLNGSTSSLKRRLLGAWEHCIRRERQFSPRFRCGLRQITLVSCFLLVASRIAKRTSTVVACRYSFRLQNCRPPPTRFVNFSYRYIAVAGAACCFDPFMYDLCLSAVLQPYGTTPHVGSPFTRWRCKRVSR